MKATKYEIYVPPHLRQAVLQYVQRHVLLFYMDEHYLCVIAEKSKEFEAALDAAIAYVTAKTSQGFAIVATPCTLTKE